jgi:multisubunit Na+/H+ antiporter MnhE subunit
MLIPLQRGDLIMGLLVAYIVCLLVGQSITIAIGLSIDRFYSSTISLPISLALYFLMFGIAWKVAVRITEPKAEKITPPSGS